MSTTDSKYLTIGCDIFSWMRKEVYWGDPTGFQHLIEYRLHSSSGSPKLYHSFPVKSAMKVAHTFTPSHSEVKGWGSTYFLSSSYGYFPGSEDRVLLDFPNLIWNWMGWHIYPEFSFLTSTSFENFQGSPKRPSKKIKGDRNYFRTHSHLFVEMFPNIMCNGHWAQFLRTQWMQHEKYRIMILTELYGESCASNGCL